MSFLILLTQHIASLGLDRPKDPCLFSQTASRSLFPIILSDLEGHHCQTLFFASPRETPGFSQAHPFPLCHLSSLQLLPHGYKPEAAPFQSIPHLSCLPQRPRGLRARECLTLLTLGQALRVSMEEQRQRQEEEARRAAAASAAEAGIATAGTEGERGGI